MKNILFATTAVSVALVAQSAFADVTNKKGAISVELTGNVRFEAGIVLDEDNDDTAERDGAYRTDGKIQWNIVGENEAGLRYGAEIDMDDVATDKGVGINEAYVFVGGNWGQLRFGDKEGIINTLDAGGPGGFGSGGFDGNYGSYLIHGGADYSTNGITSGDDTRITYLSPDIGLGRGTTLNAGLSYAPSNNSGKKGGTQTRVEGDEDSLFDIGAKIGGEAGSFEYNVSAAFAFADNNADGGDDHTGWRLGLDVAFGLGSGELGAAIGYYDDDDNDVETSSIWGEVTYSVGSFTLGANAVSTDEDNNDDDDHAFAFGVSYDITTGLDAYSDVTFSDKGDDHEGTVVLAGIKVSF